MIDPRLHFVVVTAIIVKNGRFLIAKRSEREKVFPGRWTVPGGKLVLSEYQQLPTTPGAKIWYNVVDWVLRKEVLEEVGLEIHQPHYVCDLVIMRPDGYPSVTLSYWAKHKTGAVKLCKDLTAHAWVTLAAAKNYDLIEGIWDELKLVNKVLKTKST